jgi:hypothetical protein
MPPEIREAFIGFVKSFLIRLNEPIPLTNFYKPQTCPKITYERIERQNQLLSTPTQHNLNGVKTLLQKKDLAHRQVSLQKLT